VNHQDEIFCENFFLKKGFFYRFVRLKEIIMSVAYYPISIDEIKNKLSLRKKRYLRNFQRVLPVVKLSNIKVETNEYGETITRVDGEIPPDLPICDGQRFLFISYEQSALTHGLHKYPAKFFPELPRWLIKRYSEYNSIILEPFAGSGTTNVEAMLNQRYSIAVDVDPFSRFLIKVKTTPLNISLLRETADYLLKLLVNFNPDKISNNYIPEFPYRDNWFRMEIILELAYIKKIIYESVIDDDIRDFFLICFSSIIRSVSNADDNCTRTVIRKKLNKCIYPSMALTKFAESVLINTPKMIEFSKRCRKVYRVIIDTESDARRLKIADNSIDLAVTSPPYVNAVDYPRTHQLEIYWLGMAKGSLTPLKKKHVGTESVCAKDYKILHRIGIEDADIIIEQIFQKDQRRAYIAYKYLMDMKKNLEEVYRVLKKDGYYVIVVGNNKIRGFLFENWRYLMEIAKQIGYRIENYFASEIIKHFIKVPREERINTDWILVLKK